jgi:hypothetical protein
MAGRRHHRSWASARTAAWGTVEHGEKQIEDLKTPDGPIAIIQPPTMEKIDVLAARFPK